MKTKLYISLFCVAFFWGTTFLGIRIGLETIPPFILAGLRNFISGFIILIYILYTKKFEFLSASQLVRCLLLSLLMIVFANGLTTYSEKFITSGLASIISTLSPFFVLVLNLILGNEKISGKTIIGIFLGIIGIFLIYQNNLIELLNPEYRIGILAILIAVLSWAIGTIITKKGQKKPAGMLMNICIQMLMAAVILTSMQYVITPIIAIQNWSFRSVFAVFYLAIFGSVIGYIAYNYLMTQLPSTKVAILSYVNVVVALFLGWLLLDEVINLRIIFATTLILSGVFIVNFKSLKKNN